MKRVFTMSDLVRYGHFRATLADTFFRAAAAAATAATAAAAASAAATASA